MKLHLSGLGQRPPVWGTRTPKREAQTSWLVGRRGESARDNRVNGKRRGKGASLTNCRSEKGLPQGGPSWL